MTRTLHVLIVVVCALVLSACKNPPMFTGPTSVDSGTNGPEFFRLVDGAGNPGPVTFRWLELARAGNPVPFKPAGSDTIISVNPFTFKAEVCMDPVPNPTNSPNLSEMALLVFGSADGNQPVGVTSAASEGGAPYGVRSGSCVIIKRLQPSRGGTEGSQWILVDLSARYVLIAATFVPPTLPQITPPSQEWGTSCPSFEEIAKSNRRPPCVLRFATPLPE